MKTFALLVYALAVTLFGIYQNRKSGKDIAGYFRTDRNTHWLWLSLSIVATETSSLTFISIPGLAYLGGFSFLYVALGYLVGRVLIALFFIPSYFQGEWISIYELLRQKFDRNIQLFASISFHITRLLADGVRLFATALPLSFLMQWSVEWTLIFITLATLFYTVQGGLRSVIFVDALQFTIYISAAVLIFIYLGSVDIDSKSYFDANLKSFIDILLRKNLFSTEGYNIINGIIGGTLLSFASHGTDHIFVQRILAARNHRDAQKAIIASGIFVILQFGLFLSLGIWLKEFLHHATLGKADELIPSFISTYLPLTFQIFLIFGIFSAAMSSLSSSINSLSSSTSIDLLSFPQSKKSDREKLILSKSIAVLWSMAILAFSLMLSNTTTPLVEIGLSIASVSYGPLLSIFILGNFNKKIEDKSKKSILFAAIFSLLVNIYIVYFTEIFWLWFISLGIGAFFTAYLPFLLLRKIRA